ncbi:hypothetical protein RISK_003806 [Rhodopirellula islandica]|uniref:Uncharacterized protein n=1 Tax=Rhodopirellula islandica TaxID=595434 RepID=A0A0J1BC52_RHOIS|nr:hypothetical protein RISK_003806 [Rhodopirellula islandica]
MQYPTVQRMGELESSAGLAPFAPLASGPAFDFSMTAVTSGKPLGDDVMLGEGPVCSGGRQAVRLVAVSSPSKSQSNDELSCKG